MFSAYMLDPRYGWIATHRLSEDDAIKVCQAYREYHHECPVALVPDCVNPEPYLRVAVGIPHYGAANPRAKFAFA